MSSAIDVHCHYTPAAMQAALERVVAADPIQAALLGPIVDGRREELRSLAGRFEEMEAAGVAQFLISPPPPGPHLGPGPARPALAREMNDELLGLAAADPPTTSRT